MKKFWAGYIVGIATTVFFLPGVERLRVSRRLVSVLAFSSCFSFLVMAVIFLVVLYLARRVDRSPVKALTVGRLSEPADDLFGAGPPGPREWYDCRDVAMPPRILGSPETEPEPAPLPQVRRPVKVDAMTEARELLPRLLQDWRRPSDLQRDLRGAGVEIGMIDLVDILVDLGARKRRVGEGVQYRL